MTYHRSGKFDSIDMIFCGCNNDLSTGSTNYMQLNGTQIGTAENYRAMVMPYSGTFKDMQVVLTGSPSAGKSYTFSVSINGSSGNLSVAIANSETSGEDLVNIDHVNKGDIVSVKCVPSGTPTARRASVSLGFLKD